MTCTAGFDTKYTVIDARYESSNTLKSGDSGTGTETKEVRKVGET